MNATLKYNYGDTAIAYEIIGEERKPLVLLHGWGVSSQTMKPLAKQLSGIRTCYLIDLPGFGASSEPPVAWGITEYSQAVEQFIAQVIGPPVDMLVHSFGSRITLKLCAQKNTPITVDKVLITGGAGMKPHRTLSFYLKKYTAKALKLPFMWLPERLEKKSLSWLRSTPVWRMLGSSDYQKLEGVMRETFVRCVTEYLENCLPHIEQEILLLWGETDEATPLYQAKRLEKGLKNAALVTIKGAGHYAFLDQPQKFTAIAKAFYKG